MFIQYDELELLELFLREPVNILDDESGEYMYTYEDGNKFKLILMIGTYEKMCRLSLTYNDFDVFDGEFRNVTSLEKKGDSLFINVEGQEAVRIKFSKQVGIELL
ncbi:hypothetical protein PWEIH_14881 [Listeria weihenstephanensis FSL R9-0317]|uniref:Uncharacterized protein n=1 Tax=Listeria weihenstephanensis TaxID=1006155 RepID=A0A1S7FYQ2_9LIST|nr:hypothetical protein UE46_10815 [Listeria weihenstephanensis]EUJ35838.1 hypothetical protein PWEIH_14881 [Listeria weihenstephanensis FSL R9-0317]